MSTTNVYKVHYHFQDGSGKKISPDYVDYVSAAGNDYNSLRSVLSSNSKLLGAGTLVVQSAINVGVTAFS